jgi:hypothetical protein
MYEVLAHPHEREAPIAGNHPQWHMPRKHRNEHDAAMHTKRHYLREGLAGYLDMAEAATPYAKSGGLHNDTVRRHFPPRPAEEHMWRPTFRRAEHEVLEPRATGRRTVAPPTIYDHREELGDLPRGRKRIPHPTDPEAAELPLFKSLRCVRDPATGSRVADLACETTSDALVHGRRRAPSGSGAHGHPEMQQALGAQSMPILSANQRESVFRAEFDANMSVVAPARKGNDADTAHRMSRLARQAGSRQGSQSLSIAAATAMNRSVAVARQRAEDQALVAAMPSIPSRAPLHTGDDGRDD